MAKKNEWNDPCGLTNYCDEKHRDDRYENGNPPTTTVVEFRSIEDRGTEITKSGESKTGANGIDIMEGAVTAIKAFDNKKEKADNADNIKE